MNNENDYYKMIFDKYVEEQKELGLWIDKDDFYDDMKKSIVLNPLGEKKKKKKPEKTPEQIKKEQDYFRKVNSNDPFIIPKPVFIESDYNTAAKRVYNLLESRLKGNVNLTQNDKHVYRMLTKYFIKQSDGDFKGDTNKGICLFGDVGSGKTIAMEVFAAFTCNNTNKFIVHDMKEIAREANLHGVIAIKEFTKGICCYDDVGFEEQVNHYGSKICVFTEIVNVQYEKFRNTGKPFHMTTNLGFNNDFGFGTLFSKYDRRVVDRLREMMNIIELTGNSKRK